MIGLTNAIEKMGIPSKNIRYLEQASSLATARSFVSAATAGNYTLFMGGYTGSSSTTVDAYDKSLAKIDVAKLPSAQRGPSTSVGEYALLCGGVRGTSKTGAVVAYDSSLTQTIPTALSSSRDNNAAISIGNYALVCGGSLGTKYSATVDTYNTSLTKGVATNLSTARTQLTTGKIGNHALVCGGMILSGADTTVVDAYDTALTHSNPTALSIKRRISVSASSGSYCLIAGGNQGSTGLKSSEAYDKSLTHYNLEDLNFVTVNGYGTGTEDYALIPCGVSNNLTKIVSLYNKSMTLLEPLEMSVARRLVSAITIDDDYVLIAGGQPASGYSDIVDVYELY